MAKSIVQWFADKIQRFVTPLWWVELMQQLQDATVNIFKQFTKEMIDLIKNKIIEVAADDSLSGAQKFENVKNYCRKDLNLKSMRDKALDKAIQDLVVILSFQGKF